MAELTEQQEQQQGETKKPRRSHNGLWFGIIILIVISLAAGGFYLFMQLRDRQEGLGGEVKVELNKQIGDYQNQLTAIQSQLASLQADIAGKDTHFTKALSDFSALHDQKLDSTRKDLNEAITYIQRQLGKTRGDWLMADAEYLLSIANERLHLIGDINTTREALEAADQRLRESGDAAAFKVRDQIAKEIALLRAVSVTDIVGMYASLDSLASQVDKLSLLLPYSGKALTPAKPDNENVSENTEKDDLLGLATEKLQGIVTIRHTDQPINQILTPEEALFIREQLRVKLEIIKISLVQHNETLYHSSLLDARNWVEQHFNKTDDSKNLLAELDRLAAIKITSHYPDISLSLKMLKDITKLRIETDKAIEPIPSSQPAAVVPTPVQKDSSHEVAKPEHSEQDKAAKPTIE